MLIWVEISIALYYSIKFSQFEYYDEFVIVTLHNFFHTQFNRFLRK